jgi:glycerol-3-phosphate acyltransferase PlsY
MYNLLLFSCIIPLAYLIGSLPTSYWLCWLVGGVDITQHGSGNSGASNAARVMGHRFFIPVALIDASKAYATLALGAWLMPQTIECCGLMLFVPYAVAAALLIGNGYSPFLRFRGGKGVATTVGILWYLAAWPISTAFMIGWLSLVVLTKRPFLASFGALALAWAVALATDVMVCRSLLLMLTVWMGWRHVGNLRAALHSK